jgi:hypothetical protein
VFPFSKARRARFLVRAQVDGVYSAPELGTDPDQPDFGRITGPEVDLS